MALIYVVEDDKNISEIESFALKNAGHQIVECASGKEFHKQVIERIPDLILLDIMLPGGSGLSLLEELKKMRKKESVIIISAKDSLEDKVAGLDLGADDYLAKPFHLAELNARVKSLLRRRQANGDMSIVLDNLVLYPDKRTAFVDDVELLLNRKEFDLLYYFASNPNRLMNKTSLAESVWGDNIDQADSLDFIYSQVKNLRKKMKSVGATAEIKAVYGFGYKLVLDS